MSAKLNDQLIDLYECRVCGQYIVPPILRCSDHHLFCSQCWLNSSDKALCQVCGRAIDEQNMRCTALEDLAEVMQLRFPCKRKGCGARVMLNELQSHVSICDAKSVINVNSTSSQTSGRFVSDINLQDIYIPIILHKDFLSTSSSVADRTRTSQMQWRLDSQLRNNSRQMITKMIPSYVRIDVTPREIEEFIFSKADTRIEYDNYMRKFITDINDRLRDVMSKVG